jgi:outer membrane receptor protein involved in Fe transport
VATESKFSAQGTSCIGLFGATCLEPSPKWKGVTNIYWRDGQLTVDLRWRLIDSVMDDRIKINGVSPSTITNPVIPTTHYFDLSASYDITDNLTFSGGLNNIFALKPPKEVKNSGYGYTWPSTYDPFGQTFFFNLVAKTN